MDLTSCAAKEESAPLGPRAPELSGREAPSGLYPACLRLSRLKMLSMLSTSLRGLHAGRYLPDPAPPEQLDLDSLLVLSASQSGCLLEGEEGVGVLAEWWWLVEAAISERMPAGKEEEDEEERGRLRMMLLIVSLKSRRRLVEDEKEEEDLGRWRGTCCSFNVSPGGEREEV